MPTDRRTEINRLRGLIAGLKPWETLDIPLEMNETEHALVQLGAAPVKTDTVQMTADVQAAAPSVIVQEVSKDKQQKYYAFICLKEEKEQLLEALRPYNFSAVTLADQKGTATEAMHRYEKEIEKNEKNIAEDEEILKKLVAYREHIEFLYDSLMMRRDRARVVGDMVSTEMVFYFDGWMPAKAQPEVEALLKEYEFYYNIEEPDPDDESVPVLLQNNSIVTPFEAVTGMYSLPGRHDIDPTAILAPFYFLFFGLMLSDAAYGLILTTLCAIILKKYKPEGTTHRMIKMFMFCGLSTFMWGALFGGWFGNFFTVAAKTFFGKEFVIRPLWFDPLSEPMRLLVVSLILGAIHLFVGMGVQAYMDIKDGRPLDALFDIGLWYLLLIGIVLFAFGGKLGAGAVGIGKIMAIVGAVGILLTGGRKKKGIFGKLTGGLGSLYGITSYLSDVLSYSRLLALGLATGVVAQVFNTLGSLAGGGIAGSILLIVVFAFGTVFNIAINALGAFVHSCRLQYVEFFGKFYTGGGRPFAPFERKTKYIKILKEGNDNVK
ncbi:MAG: V-type ATP synthase subunit I [Anaerotignum faecicola]